jgi:hypothetical protein
MFRVPGTSFRNEEPERPGTASQNGMERWSDATGTWRWGEEDLNRGQTWRASGSRLPAAGTAAKGSRLRRRDSTRLAARSTPGTCASALGRPPSLARRLPPLSSAAPRAPVGRMPQSCSAWRLNEKHDSPLPTTCSTLAPQPRQRGSGCHGVPSLTADGEEEDRIF